MTTARAGIVGVIVDDLASRSVSPILAGVEDALGARCVAVLLADARGDAVREGRRLRALLELGVDGLIVIGGPWADPRPSVGRDLPVPVVHTYAPSEDPKDLSLVVDGVRAGRLAAEHLWELGRRRIGFVGGDPICRATLECEAGAVAALVERGANLLSAGVRVGNGTERWGRAATVRLLDRYPDLDAVIAASDQLARAAIEMLREAGRTVPEDVAVVGHGNRSGVVEHTRPELTSIDERLESLGQAATMRILDALAGQELGRGVEVIGVELVIRGSTVPDE